MLLIVIFIYRKTAMKHIYFYFFLFQDSVMYIFYKKITQKVNSFCTIVY